MKKQQIQQQITVSAYEAKTIYDTFRNTLEWLEKYIEKSGYYPDWQSRKQIHDNEIQRADINSINIVEIRNLFSTVLFGLRHMVRNKPPFIREQLAEEFYKWFDKSGIDSNNCPSELTQCLVNIHEVLEGRGEEFAEERIRQADENIEKLSKEERTKKFNEAFTSYHEPLRKEHEKAKSLENQTYKSIAFENNFEGDAERGKATFRLIVGSSSSQSNNPQQRTNSEILQDIRQNPRNWRTDEIITDLGENRQETVLIHQSACLDDYDQQTGRLNLVNNPVYQASRFSAEEIAQINQALNISQQQSAQVQQPPYKWNF